MPDEVLQMMRDDGYDPDAIKAYETGVEKALKESPVAVLKIQGKFNANIFNEQVQQDLLKRIERQYLKENTLEVAKPAPAQP